MDEIKLTPMMKQYQRVKSEIPADAVLMFRLGDFYEMFFDDARTAAPVLEVVLTKRGGVPMCGIPYHALESYLPKLLEAGIKVAIAEQMEDPKQAKGIVKREITRVITPGTVMDNCVLAQNENNFLAAFVCVKGRYGLSCLDISTGDFRVTELESLEELETELHRLQVRECVVPEKMSENQSQEMPDPGKKYTLTTVDDWIFAYDNAAERLKRHFAVATLDGFGCRELRLGVAAAGAVLYYASENLRHEASHIRRLKTYVNQEHMVLDQISQRNLELVTPLTGNGREGTLISVLDKTATPMGARLLRDWLMRPLFNRDKIVARLDVVGVFCDDPLTMAEIRELTGAIRDLERITARLTVGSANARDLQVLAAGLAMIPELKNLLAIFDIPLLCELRSKLHGHPELVEEIQKAIADDPSLSLSDGGIIRDGYHEVLDSFRQASTEGKNWLAKLQAQEVERTGIKSLKVRFNKVFGYYIEVSKSNLANVPEDYIRKQTLVNAERFITPELKEIENKILGADDKAKALEYEIFQGLREKTLQFTDYIQESAAALAAIDVLTALAENARIHGYCRPLMVDDNRINIKAGRHPVLDASMQDESFVPNDVLLDGIENRMMIITGPNMAGKSTYIRQVALLVIMAQIGSFIPAEKAEIGLVDRVFTRIGAADDISRGQSTFMVEMVETANILNHAGPSSLVILDEIGRGTSTFDGLSIAWAVAEFLHNNPASRAMTMFATHYHELTELAITCPGVKNYNVAVREYGDQIIFLRQIIPGGTDKSYGIHVAKLAGLPESVVARANEILENLENSAIGEAGLPVLSRHTEKLRKSAKKRKNGETEQLENLQLTLFDWAGDR